MTEFRTQATLAALVTGYYGVLRGSIVAFKKLTNFQRCVLVCLCQGCIFHL